jgi:hypothetical protein
MTDSIDMLVTVKAYPQVSSRYGETVCVAGVRTDTETPRWVRLYPVVYRDLQWDLRFAKYQRITVDVSDANDPRPESLRPNLDTMKLGDKLGTERGWGARRRVVEPLRMGSMCEVLAQQGRDRASLGVFRPAHVDDLIIEPDGDDWEAGKKGIVTSRVSSSRARPAWRRSRTGFSTSMDAAIRRVQGIGRPSSIGRSGSSTACSVTGEIPTT